MPNAKIVTETAPDEAPHMEFVINGRDGDKATVTVTGYRNSVTALLALAHLGKMETLEQIAREMDAFYDDQDDDDDEDAGE